MYIDNIEYLNNAILCEFPKECGVYMILCKTNGKSYIGSSLNIYKRVKDHFSNLIFDRHEIIELNKDFKEYGIESFEVFQLVSCDKDLRCYMEGYYIKKYNSINNGYNNNNAGVGTYYESENDVESLIYEKPKKIKSEIEILENKCKEILNDNFENSQVISLDNLINDYRIMITECLTYEGLLKIIEKFNFKVYIKSRVSSFYYQCKGTNLKHILNGTLFRCNQLLTNEYEDLMSLNINDIYIECPGFKNIESYKENVELKNTNIEYEICNLKEKEKVYSKEYIELTREINSFYISMYHNKNYDGLLDLRKKCYARLKNINENIETLSNKKIKYRTKNKHTHGFLLSIVFKGMYEIIDLK